MLEDGSTIELGEVISQLPCHIQLPAEMNDFFSRKGTLASIENDNRRFARKHFRTRALLQIRETLPSLDRSQAVHVVFTNEISRGGISFLHSEQLYPGEKCQLWFADQTTLRTEVVRCSRLESQCYHIGCSLSAG